MAWSNQLPRVTLALAPGDPVDGASGASAENDATLALQCTMIASHSALPQLICD